MLYSLKWQSPFRHLALEDDRATIDFETRSTGDIQRIGAWKYSKHPSTRVLCLSFRLPGDDRPSLWHAGYFDDEKREWIEAGIFTGSPRKLEDLFEWIKAGGIVEAHNAFFERCIWEHIFTRPPTVDEFGCVDYRRGVGAPPIAFKQWRCSAAKAAAFGLPRDLGGACNALFGEDLKDMEGRRVMLRLAKPRAARKGERKGWTYWHEDTASFLRLFAYCITDTASEHRLSVALPDLSPEELKVWRADFKANWRGIRVDLDLCRAALKLEAEVKRRWNKELQEISGIESGTLRLQILAWLREKGVPITDTKAATLDAVLEGEEEFSEYGALVNRVVFIARNINRVSISKYKRILEMVDEEDSRCRDLVMYHGAHTGRWAGRGVQIQNLVRGVLLWADGSDMTMAEAVELVMRGDIEEIELRYWRGDVLLLLASTCRGAFLPSKGKVLMCADYSAIEARVVLWLAGCEEALDVFRRGDDLYCDMASSIYRREITKKDKNERFFGKTAILSLGFGVGFMTFMLRLRQDLRFTVEEAEEILGKAKDRYYKWVARAFDPQKEHFQVGWKYETEKDAEFAYRMAVNTARLYKWRLSDNRIPDWNEVAHELALCKMVVDKYRERFALVVQMWAEQEDAAVNAVRNPGQAFQAGKLLWCVEEQRLFCQLPSGRYLTYADPVIKEVKTPWGQKKPQICFMGVEKGNGPKRWTQLSTYGASLVENITQACARDVMADAFVRADETEAYTPITTVHDELINEMDEDTADVQEFDRFMTTVPPAFMLCPIAAESGMFHRYQK